MDKKTNDLTFEIIVDTKQSASFTATCSGSRSDCCTRVCTRTGNNVENLTAEAWEDYLEINAGVLQY